ncbi:MAG: glycosyltransferase [Myxococcaceae bacterium]|nr:glycosyltransferase [Myxococcaceae bacterium]
MPARDHFRLGFVTGRMGSLDGGALWADAGLGRLIDALAARADTLSVALSVADQKRASHDHRTEVSRAQLVALPHMPSTIASLPHGGACRTALHTVEERSDAIIVQLPFAPPWALVPSKRPRVYHACSDPSEVVRASPYYRGFKRIAATSFADFIHTWQRQLLKRPDARLIANGDALRGRLADGGGRAIVSSALLEREVDSVKRRRPAGAPFRILFVGYLRPEKGLDVLLRAYRRVLERRPDAELVIVGARDLAEAGAESDLARDVTDLQGKASVTLAGLLPFGPRLFQAFADADVLALPSRSEGTPRVLVEARAFRCPVIGSNVGGIPTSIADGDDGLLFPSGDDAALAAALMRVADDGALRARLVERGLQRARRSTVDAVADVLFAEARALCA